MATAPSDFSRMLVSPPSLFPGDGIVVEAAAEAGQVLLVASDEAQQLLRHLPVARAAHQQMLGAEDLGGLRQHRASRRLPPAYREQTPSAGLAVMPENESEPPQFSPSTILDAGDSTRCSAAACSIKLANLARAPPPPRPRVPPLDCRVIPTRRLARGALGRGNDRSG